MKEISLHILDIVQNSLQAEATDIFIEVKELIEDNLFEIEITDNGKGMTEEQIQKVLDPFYTTKNKKTGLGIPLLKQHVEMTGGKLLLQQGSRNGVIIKAIFKHDHIDRQPMGDITNTITGIIRANPDLHIQYKHTYNNNSFVFDTEEIKAELGEIAINSKEVLNFMNEYIRDNINEISAT